MEAIVMGMLIKDSTTADILHQLRDRFSEGGPLREMVAIQKEFGVFSKNYSLKQAFRLLHIVPGDFTERGRWYRFLDQLKKYRSDQDGVSGHDRIVNAYRENLMSNAPLPVFMTTHRAADDRRVTVSRGRAVVHEAREYVVISIPTIADGETLRTGRPKGGRKTAARGRKAP
jgi:hypothetical protein